MNDAFTPSAACCSTPSVIGPPYRADGTFFEVNGMRIYRTGPQSATKALFVIYDVFGYSSQILQGADILAKQDLQVFMPDFFNGDPAPMTWMQMPDVSGKEPPADEKALDDFCNGPGNTERTIDNVFRLQKALQASSPNIVKWGLVGYCWGGYVVNFLLQADSPFAACAELHPGFPGKEIAQQIARPILALCSKDEPDSEYAHFAPHLKGEFTAIHFATMLHGWMSSRGDLSKPEVETEYRRGYDMLVKFFSQHL